MIKINKNFKLYFNRIKKPYLFLSLCKAKIKTIFSLSQKKVSCQQGKVLIDVILVLIIVILLIIIGFFIIRERELFEDVKRPLVQLLANGEVFLEIEQGERINLQWHGILVQECIISWEEQTFGGLAPSGEKEITEYLTVDDYIITIECSAIEELEGEIVFDKVAISVNILQPEIPLGWIKVPQTLVSGDKIEAFLVMQYEARQGDNNQPISVPEGLPWTNISQLRARGMCRRIGGDLISDLQWMAIANDIAEVDENWTGERKGRGYLRRGHSDNLPNRALSADNIDEDEKQQRTFRLSNNEIIWDVAGNVQEWTSDSIARSRIKEEIVPVFSGWTEYAKIIQLLEEIEEIKHIKPLQEIWTSQEGIGKLYVPAEPMSAGYHFVRGGAWDSMERAGIFALSLRYGMGYSDATIGFRCVKPL